MDFLKGLTMTQETINKTKFSSGNLFARLTENLKTKLSWKIGIGVVVLFCLLSFAYSIFNKKLKEIRTQTLFKTEDEKREIFKERDLRRIGKGNSSEERSRKSERATIVKRNYATDMAVFVFKEKEARTTPRSSSKVEKVKLGLPAGTKISALTSGSIFSYNIAAPVTVTVSQDIEKNGKVVIPKDSQFLGEAGVLKSLNRINVNFDLLIFPDGRQVRVRAMALSEDGSSGIKGRVNKHQDKRVFKALGETVLAGPSIFGRGGGVSSNPYSLEDHFRENAFDNLTGMAREDLRNTKVETSIIVDSLTPVEVILLEAV